jgi:FkbM family methyltransferase
MGLWADFLTQVRRALRRLIELAGGALTRAAPLLYRSERERETARRQAREARWYAVRGDQTLRLAYDLGPEAVVLDAGGYHGDWAADIYCKFGCRIHLFEPVPEFADTIERRFERNESITLHRYGLAGEDRCDSIELDQGGSSTVLTPVGIDTRTEEIKLRDVIGVLERLDLEEIDLLKINIEGGEYELLERLLSSGGAGRFRYLQIQFHPGAPDAGSRTRAIQDGLSRTHRQMWSYPWVWESWERRT